MTAGSGRVRMTLGLVAAGLVLALGLLVRLIGLDHGRPNWIFHPDVPKQTYVARAVALGDCDLRALHRENREVTLYPFGTAWLAGRLVRAAAPALGGLEAVRAWPYWRWALVMRYEVVALHLAALAMVMGLLWRAWGPAASLGAGLVLALEPVNAQFSHYAMNDVPLAALLLMAWLGALRMAATAGRAGLLWSAFTGLVLGFGFGVKYQMVLGGLFPMVAWGVLARRGGWRRVWPSLAVLGLTGVMGVVVFSPMLRQDPVYFVTGLPGFMKWQANILGESASTAVKFTRNLGGVARALAQGCTPLLALLAAGGAVRAFRRRDAGAPAARLRAGLAAGFAALLLLLVMASRDFIRVNDLLPVLAFLAVLTGELFAGPSTSLQRPFAGVAAAALMFCAAGFGVTAFADAVALTRPDTRVRAMEWCRTHLPPRAVVVSERYVLPMDRPDLVHRPFRFLVSPEVRPLLESGQPLYLLASSLAHRRFSEPFSGYTDAARARFYADLERHRPVQARFEDRPLYFAHPAVTVYYWAGAMSPRPHEATPHEEMK